MVDSQASASLTEEPVWVDPSRILYPVARPPIVPKPPIVPGVPIPGKRRLILNIETTGYDPLEHKIISIGLTDPLYPNDSPVVIMHEDESFMLFSLLMVIKEMNYNEIVGYGLGFDIKFLFTKAMKYNLNCKEFYDIEIYDLMQVAAQMKREFVYKPQNPPSLSNLADYLWGYPKAISDLDMIKAYAEGRLEVVREFTSAQIIRILALYQLVERISKTPFDVALPWIGSHSISENTTQTSSSNTTLTIPKATTTETWLAKCPIDLSEHDVPMEILEFKCPIDGTVIRRK